MKQYSSYKNSGVEWIGEIPSHWEKSKLKYDVILTMGQSPDSENYNDEGIGTPFLQGNTEFGKDFPTTRKWTKQVTKLSKEGDILYSVRGSLGEMNWSDIEYCIGRGICSITPINLIPKFNMYLLKVLDQEVKSISVGSTFQAITVDDVKNLFYYIPLLSEQEQIVEYLDEKTSQIDGLISITEKKIELLKQKRTSLINEAVTKGLNGNVEMRDSGVEWIGKTPKHWKKIPLKHISYMKGRIGWKGLKQEEFSDDVNLPYLITGHDIKNDRINWEKCYHISEERYEESPEIKVKINDLLFTKDGTIGKTLFIDYLPGKTSLNSHLLLIRPLNNSYNSKYLQYVFKADYFLSYVELTKTGTTFYGVSQETMMGFNGYFPPLPEQELIVEYIDNQTLEIDNLVSIEQRRIETLKEYRQSLISEVVTGKIKVTTE
jgi:type I restriction enzyme S subunit